MDSVAVKDRAGLLEWINFRMIAIAAVVLFLVGYPVYQYVAASWNQGIEKHGDVYAVDLKSLGNFPFDDSNGTKTDIPQRWRDLDGKRVALEGFMFAPDSAADDISRFQFVYNITKCCFNGPPKVQERIFAQIAGNQQVPFYSQEVRCVGQLRVVTHKNEAGKIDVVYAMLVDRVEPI